jgi:oligogalacturonide lyase
VTIGQVYPAEWYAYTDRATGAPVRQLTSHQGNSNHLYFTNYGWYHDDRRLLIGSDRDERTNLCSVDLDTGEITQLTDLAPQPLPYPNYLLRVAIHPRQEVAYFGYGREICSVDLHTGTLTPLWEIPEGWQRNMVNVTADGRYVCVGIYEIPDLAAATDRSRRYGYGGSIYSGTGMSQRATWEAKPLSRVMRIPTAGGLAEVIWEEQTWINHVNTSPTLPNILTFCHEGPWHLVDHRIWVLDTASGKVWKVRERTVEGERVGHEYWHMDGVHLGYHGERPDGTKVFGRVRYDNEDLVEAAFPFETGHMHSNDFSLIVGDGGQEVRLWRWNGEAFEGPRALCVHRSSKRDQMFHVHPRFRSDGRQVVYTSDVPGYGQVFVAEVPEFEALPEIPEPGKR